MKCESNLLYAQMNIHSLLQDDEKKITDVDADLEDEIYEFVKGALALNLNRHLISHEKIDVSTLQVQRIVAFVAASGSSEIAQAQRISTRTTEKLQTNDCNAACANGKNKQRSKLGRVGHKIAKFWKKHKKAIIIGAVVVAVVVTGAILLAGGAAAAGAGAAAALDDSSDDDKDSDEPIGPSPSDQPSGGFDEDFSLLNPEFGMSYGPYWSLPPEYYEKAVQNLEQAIKLNPQNPDLYLERSIARFELGRYESSIDDYSQYIAKKNVPLSVTDFTVGFAQGLPKGIYESGEGTLLFLSEFITHPVQASQQIVDSVSQLVTLVKNDRFGVIAESLSPELHQLVTEWETLPSEKRGELAGYTVGKLGTDFLAPGAIAKIASKSVTAAKDLTAVCAKLHLAQETLVLETAAGMGDAAKVAEIIESGRKTIAMGEDLGFTAQEMGALKETGTLESAITKARDKLSPDMRKSLELFDRAEEFLKPHKGYMPESKARELIEQTGVKTLHRPQGIPDDYRIKISKKGAGMIFEHPTNKKTSIRIMPGKPHSPLPHQQKPYVIVTKNGNVIDKYGNIVDSKNPTAHIPFEEFVYIE